MDKELHCWRIRPQLVEKGDIAAGALGYATYHIRVKVSWLKNLEVDSTGFKTDLLLKYYYS